MRVRSLAIPVLVSAVIFVREGIEFGAVVIGFAVWGVFVACCVAIGCVLAGLGCAFAYARRRQFARPNRTSVVVSVMIAFVVLFPVRAKWDTVEGPDSAGGLTAAANAVLLKANLVDDPTLAYTESCCG